mmetsp:Transcript_28447/g.111528  ORF Transcript_28447/g.111528 Transcript_28447/m.111528 type:complete len:311 (-) Transcript_28447:225-1157(-)
MAAFIAIAPFTKTQWKAARGDGSLPRPRVRVIRMGGPQRELTKWIEDNAGFGKVTSFSGGGGSGWASSSIVDTESGNRLFVKTSKRPSEAMFTGEAEGLRAMHATNTVTVPEVYHYGDLKEADGSFIIMEHLEMRGSYSQAELGKQLAMMHLAEPLAEEAKAGKFGFPVKNTIGGTPQPNDWSGDYVQFFREKRLGHQLRLARDGTLSSLGKQLMDNLDSYFEGIEVKPCILHGDLWSGNIGGTSGGKPAIFDPACYYGHNEAEFGMSWCAGFGAGFYDAYFSVIPKEKGFEERKQIYLLYHYLVCVQKP